MARSISLLRPLALACAGLLAGVPARAQETVAYTGATLWDGTGAAAVPNATLVVRGGRVVAAGAVPVPSGATVEDLAGRWVVPGLIDAHAHVTGDWAGEGVTDPRAQVVGDLALFARFGVTTVVSLGDEPEAALDVRAANASQDLRHARVHVAGPVVGGATPEAARAAVQENAARGVDWIKIRVDDNLGSGRKMPPAVYRAVIEEAHAAGLRVAAHIFYLEDARGLLDAGVDLIAHSVRDTGVDAALARTLTDNDICYVPTLVREVSTFVYAERPDFFDDPFFQDEAYGSEVARVSAPGFQQQMRESESAAAYRVGLAQAQANLGRLADAGVRVAFGTDAGPPARFPGYFEHLEMELMSEAGLSPEQILRSATGGAAACMGLGDVGTLEPGRWADFLVLRESPLERIGASRSLERVYIAGARVR